MVTIFIDNNYIGTHIEFQEYIATKYNFITNYCTLNYQQLISTDVQNYFGNDKVNKN